VTAPEAGLTLQDETFFTRAQRVGELADRIIELGMKITWAATMRADQTFACRMRSGRDATGRVFVEMLLTRWIVPAERLS
jgi:hypothetical protein